MGSARTGQELILLSKLPDGGLDWPKPVLLIGRTKTERNRLKFGFGEHLGRRFDLSVDFSREEKDGKHLQGSQGFNF